MARATFTRKSTAKKSAKKIASKAAAKRAESRRPAAKRAAPKAATPALRLGVITHTELASSDPAATQRWCEKVLGWKFGEAVSTPTGPYRMWRFANDTGGGIRENNPPEVPGSIPYCEVASIRATFSKAIASGATEMVGPMALPNNMGWIAIVAAPGGVAIGFWSTK
jgi:predicted enzyme related to lactoylglutathione lyase